MHEALARAMLAPGVVFKQSPQALAQCILVQRIDAQCDVATDFRQ